MCCERTCWLGHPDEYNLLHSAMLCLFLLVHLPFQTECDSLWLILSEGNGKFRRVLSTLVAPSVAE